MAIKQLTLMTLLFAPAIHSFAEDWTPIINKPGYQIAVDLDSYNTADGYPYIVTKTSYTAPQPLITTPAASQSQKLAYHYQIKNTQFDCRKPRYKVTALTYFSQQDKELAAAPSQATFTPIEKDTDEFSVGQLVCQVHQMVGGL